MTYSKTYRQNLEKKNAEHRLNTYLQEYQKLSYIKDKNKTIQQSNRTTFLERKIFRLKYNLHKN
jgi:hypothetical protein